MAALYDSIGINYAALRRPDVRIRSGSASFWRIGGVEAGLARLAADLASGAFAARYADILRQDSYDAGYRLVIAA